MFTSSKPDVEIPDVGVYEYLFSSLTDADLDAVALVDPGSGAETTYAALRASVDAFAVAKLNKLLQEAHFLRGQVLSQIIFPS